MSSAAELAILISSKGAEQTAASLKRIGTELGGLDKSAQAASRGMDVLGKGLAGLAAGAAAGVGFAALNTTLGLVQKGMGAVGDAAIGMNARMETAKIGFTTMLGSAQAADSFLRQLADFAAQTPFEFPELQDAAKRLMAMGFEANNVIPLMRDIGNVSAGLGAGTEGIDRMVTAMGQMTAKTKVQSEELMQLQELGVPALKLLADSMGVTAAEAQKMVSDGKVASDVFLKAFQTWSQANFGSMMEKQAKTFSGAMSTIKDSLSMAVAQGAQPFFEQLSRLAVKTAEFTSSSDFKMWAADLADGSERAVQGIGRLAEGGQKLASALGPLKELAPVVSVVAGVVVGDLTMMAGAFQAFSAQLIGTAKIGKEALAGLVDFGLGLKALVTGDFEGARESLGNIEGHIRAAGTAATDMSQQTWDGLALMASAFGQGKDAAEGMQSLFELLSGKGRQLRVDLDAVNDAFERGQAAQAASIGSMQGVAQTLDGVALAHQAAVATMDQLSTAYQTNLGFQKVLSGANSEYSSQVKAVEEAVKLLNERKAEGIPLTQQEIDFLGSAQGAVQRYTGGIEDNTIKMGMAAVANAELMTAQDALNEMLRQGIDQGPAYEEALQKVRDSTAEARKFGLDPTRDAAGQMNQALSGLQGVIDQRLIPAIEQLAVKLGGLQSPPPIEIQVATAAAEREIARIKGIISSGAVMPFSVSPQQQFEGFASGGTVPRAMVARINELGPELVRLPYAGAFAAGGTIGFANMGKSGFAALPKGAQVIPAHETRDIINRGFMDMLPVVDDVAAIEQSAEAIEELGRAFNAFLQSMDRVRLEAFSGLDKLADPAYMEGLEKNVRSAQAAFDAAVTAGADQSLVEELAKRSTLAQEQWRLAGELSGTAYVEGLKEQIASEKAAKELADAAEKAAKEAEAAAKKAADALADSWMRTLGNLDDIMSGAEGKRLREQAAKIEQQIGAALTGGAPEEVLTRLGEQLAEVQAQLARAEALRGPVVVSPWVLSGVGGNSHALSGFPGVIGSNVTGGGDIRLQQEGAKFGKLQDFGQAPPEAALGMSALNNHIVVNVELDGQQIHKSIRTRDWQNQSGAIVIGEV